MRQTSAGKAFKEALHIETPLQIIGAINANHALLAQKAGYKAIYLSGGGVSAGSLGLPDLGISQLEDVLIDARRITDVCDLPLLVDIDTGFGSSAFNIARTIRSLEKVGVAAVHMEDQVGAKRCGHRPNKELVTTSEMVDRIKAAVDARNFYQTTGGPLSIHSIQDTWSVFPNPASEEIFIQLKDYTMENASVKLLDLSGRTILQTTWNGNGFKLNIAHLNAGSYVLCIESKNEIIRKKILINNNRN